MSESLGMKRGSWLRGAYPAERAAALAGVPLSTVYYWARNAVYSPSLSREKVMLWSWADLLALRAIAWLRSSKTELSTKPTTMGQVRKLLGVLEEDYGDRLGEHLATKSIVLRVDARGKPFIATEEALSLPIRRGVRQDASSEIMIDLLAEYHPEDGLNGPHLLVPRPNLRIIPGKLGGEPHILDTRIETRAIVALVRRGYQERQLLEFYPFLDLESLSQAVDLEGQLDRNLARAA